MVDVLTTESMDILNESKIPASWTHIFMWILYQTSSFHSSNTAISSFFLQNICLYFTD